MMNKYFCAVCAAALLCGCSSTSKTLTNFVDRETLESKSASDITSQSIDIEQMKNEKMLNIAIALNVSDQTPAHARIPKAEDMVDAAYELAVNYLARIKAYKVVVLPKDVDEEEAAKIKYHFVIKMNVTFLAEKSERFDHDETKYKAAIDWKLLDNRTIDNGLSTTNKTPFVKESLTCQNETYRKSAIPSLTGARMGGSSRDNAQNAYRIALENCLIEFRAQLANRLPFGGKISTFRMRDGVLRFTLKSGAESGVMPRMQMLIMSEEGDKIAIAQATGGARKDETVLEVWRWLSPSYKKELEGIAGNRSKVKAYLAEEGGQLFAVCLGMPTPSKDERTQIND